MKWNYCPFCGHRVYHHGGDGCGHREQVHHIALLSGDSTTVKHPAREREDDKLFGCGVLMQISGHRADRPKPVGEYAVIENGSGGWAFEPPDRAYEQCDCSVNTHFFMQVGAQ